MNVFRCSECGSTDIEVRVWMNPNTGQTGSDCEDDTCWCNECEEHTKIDITNEPDTEAGTSSGNDASSEAA